MGGLLTIESVAGLSPDWSLTVVDSVGVQAGDHVLCSTGQSLAGVFRVVSVPDNLHIFVKDDVQDPPYGSPVPGEASYYTPVGALGLSQVVRGGLNYDEAQRRDGRQIGQAIRTVQLLTDPTDILAQDIRRYGTAVVTNGVPGAIVTVEDLEAGDAGLTLLIVNATASAEDLTLNPTSETLTPGSGRSLVWDGDAWVLT